ncbi:hypothetical protein M3Y97_00568600 [Aphelenchoides bicaudatus]|nr:hypothetical protein M3Y97_00568600 [Aphelenchoides bicaudatus]
MESNESPDEFFPLYHYQYRIILIGDSTVGKSSLLRNFVDNRKAGIIEPTVGVDFYTRLVEIKPNYRVKLQIWDTAGQEKFRSITTAYYRNSAAVIVVYDTTNRQSFENVTTWLDEAEMNIGGANPSESVFLLVGHKADLEEKRQVLYEEGEYFAKYRKIKFIETSAVTGENVNEAFLMVAREISNKFETGVLQLSDGWDGIKKSGLMRSQSISLSDYSRDASAYDNSNCSC